MRDRRAPKRTTTGFHLQTSGGRRYVRAPQVAAASRRHPAALARFGHPSHKQSSPAEKFLVSDRRLRALARRRSTQRSRRPAPFPPDCWWDLALGRQSSSLHRVRQQSCWSPRKNSDPITPVHRPCHPFPPWLRNFISFEAANVNPRAGGRRTFLPKPLGHRAAQKSSARVQRRNHLSRDFWILARSPFRLTSQRCVQS